MTNYAQHIAETLQTEQAHPDQRENNAGGYSFTLDCWKRLDRFLILGAEGGTYYVAERKLARDNAKAIDECLREDGARTVKRIAEISDSGRAPKNDPAIFALAIAASDKDANTRAAALAALPTVCRTGTHLFHFAASVNALRGWGRGLRRAMAKWYLDKSPKDAAYQVVKYQQRDGWSHRDVLRLCHAEANGSASHEALFRWITTRSLDAREVKRRKADKNESISYYGAVSSESAPELLAAYEDLVKTEKTADVVKLIERFRFTHEMIPTQHKNAPEVWEALLPHMPMTATIRNLGKMTSVGLIKPLSEASAKVAERIGDVDSIRKARVHPIALLAALRVYAQGRGERGSLTWSPDARVIDALDDAFYLAFDAIEPTGKSIMMALDISGSMGAAALGNMPGLTARDVSAAMAMATARTESSHLVVGFSHQLVQLNISPKQRLDDVVRSISNLPFGGTDCSLPMLAALANKIAVDAFCVYTDSETWAGNVHPHAALDLYRQGTGRASKLIVCGTTATEFTIADPKDHGMLDVVGFSADCPAVLADFIRAE